LDVYNFYCSKFLGICTVELTKINKNNTDRNRRFPHYKCYDEIQITGRRKWQSI